MARLDGGSSETIVSQPAFEVGDVLWADLPQRHPHGHEQAGRRPVVVVAVPETIQPIPYRLLVVVPVTRTRLKGPLFPTIPAGAGGLPSESTALTNQVLSLDAVRLVGRLGRLSPEEYKDIEGAFRLLFSKRA